MKMLKQKFTRLRQADKGSVLVFTLLITGLMLATAISLITVSSIERKTSGSSSKSTQSFQVADSAVETVIEKVNNNPTGPISSLGTGCVDGVGIISMLLANGSASVTLYSDTDANDQITGCNTELSKVVKIKSVGTYAGTSRAIEALATYGECIGGTTLIASSGNALYTLDNIKDVKKFIDDQRGLITSFTCKKGTNSGIVISSPSTVTYTTSTAKNPKGSMFIEHGSYSGDFIECGDDGYPNECGTNGGADECSGGWEIYGSCSCLKSFCNLDYSS